MKYWTDPVFMTFLYFRFVVFFCLKLSGGRAEDRFFSHLSSQLFLSGVTCLHPLCLAPSDFTSSSTGSIKLRPAPPCGPPTSETSEESLHCVSAHLRLYLQRPLAWLHSVSAGGWRTTKALGLPRREHLLKLHSEAP